MAPECSLQAVLLSVLLFTGSIGQGSLKDVYRFPHDTINLHDDDYQDRSNLPTSTALPKLASDDDSPIQPFMGGPPYNADNSQNQPPQGSNEKDKKPATYPQNAQGFFYKAVPDQNSQSSDWPIMFPLNPSQQSQGQGAVLWPVPQSSPHQVPQGSSQPSSNAWYNWPPVGSNPFYGVNPQTNGFRRVNNGRLQFYNGKPFGQKPYNSGGASNEPVNNDEPRPPPGYPRNPQTANIPAGQDQFFYINYGPADYKNQMHVPRYVVQSRNGYVANRYVASKMSYDPDL